MITDPSVVRKEVANTALFHIATNYRRVGASEHLDNLP